MPESAARLSHQALLALWAEQNLTASQQAEFEQRCLQDPDFAEQVASFNQFAALSDSYQQQEVPAWDSDSTFAMAEKTSWWQWQWLPGLSFASSILAIVLVVSGLQVRMDEGAMTISFASKQSAQDIDRMVEARLDKFKQTQQLALAQYTENMQQQQLDASTQLTQYLLVASRKERREDFAELIKYVNEQRGDDQLFYARQLNKLQRNLYAKPDQVGASNLNE